MSYRNYTSNGGMQKSNQTAAVQASQTRSILRNVYIWMTGGLALTGIIALAVSKSPGILRALTANRFTFFMIIIAELALVLLLSARIMKMRPGTATLGFIAYAALNGLTLSVVFLAYTGVTIATAFFVTAGTFAGMSIYGSFTKRDLSRIGTYLVMALIGIIIASVVNIFLRSSGLYYAISYIGVIIFLGLTAWDTQIIKRWSSEYGGSVSEDMYVKLSILGALKLYLDFINLFLFFLRIFGRRG